MLHARFEQRNNLPAIGFSKIAKVGNWHRTAFKKAKHRVHVVRDAGIAPVALRPIASHGVEVKRLTSAGKFGSWFHESLSPRGDACEPTGMCVRIAEPGGLLA